MSSRNQEINQPHYDALYNITYITSVTISGYQEYDQAHNLYIEKEESLLTSPQTHQQLNLTQTSLETEENSFLESLPPPPTYHQLFPTPTTLRTKENSSFRKIANQPPYFKESNCTLNSVKIIDENSVRYTPTPRPTSRSYHQRYSQRQSLTEVIDLNTTLNATSLSNSTHSNNLENGLIIRQCLEQGPSPTPPHPQVVASQLDITINTRDRPADNLDDFDYKTFKETIRFACFAFWFCGFLGGLVVLICALYGFVLRKKNRSRSQELINRSFFWSILIIIVSLVFWVVVLYITIPCLESICVLGHSCSCLNSTSVEYNKCIKRQGSYT